MSVPRWGRGAADAVLKAAVQRGREMVDQLGVDGPMPIDQLFKRMRLLVRP